MPTTTVRPADTLSTLAARVFPGGEVSRFREILEANPDLDVFADLPEAIELNLPSVEQIQSFAAPVLSQVSTSLGGARGFLGQTQNAITQIAANLPPELQGYTQDALTLVGEANGVLDQAESAIASSPEQLRNYGAQATNLIQWLLSGKA